MRLLLCGLLCAVLPLSAYQPGDSYFPVRLPLEARDILFEPVRGKLLAAFSSATANNPSNSLGIIHAETGVVEAAINLGPLGPEPTVLAVSDDGRYAYVGYAATPLVRRVDLIQRRMDLEIPLGVDPQGRSTFAESIAVAPGLPTRIAVSRMIAGFNPRHVDVVLVDNAVVRPRLVPVFAEANRIAFGGDATRLFGVAAQSVPSYVSTFAVTPTGVSFLSSARTGFTATDPFVVEAGRAFLGSGRGLIRGGVWDVSNGVEIGRTAAGFVAPFTAAGVVAVLSRDSFLSRYELIIHDLATLSVRDRFPLPPEVFSPTRFVRMGSRGFAVLANTNAPFQTGSETPVITLLVRDESLRPVLSNASTRGTVGAGDDVMIAGFVVQGTGPRTMLVRVLGPSLAAFGVSGALADPTLEIYSGSVQIAQNDDWRSASALTVTEAARLQLAPGSDRESLLALPLTPGAYTAIVRSKPGATGGVALVEAYDVSAYGGDFLAGAAKAVNLSTRATVGGGDVMISGFVVTGTLPRRILLTGIGPSLASFGVARALGNPRLELYQGARKLAENDDWIQSEQLDEIVNTGNSPRAHTEPAIFRTLNPGAYTAVLSGADGGSGVALAEVHDARAVQDISLARPNLTNSTASLATESGGVRRTIAFTFFEGTAVAMDDMARGNYLYVVTGRNTARVSLHSGGTDVLGTLRFFRANTALFVGEAYRPQTGWVPIPGLITFAP